MHWLLINWSPCKHQPHLDPGVQKRSLRMTPTFIHSAQFWTWLLEWTSEGTVLVMFFLSAPNLLQAPVVCELGPNFISSAFKAPVCFPAPSSLSRCVLYHHQAAPGPSLFWEGAPVRLASLYGLSWCFLFLERCPIIQIIIILWNQLKCCFFLAWSLTGFHFLLPYPL